MKKLLALVLCLMAMFCFAMAEDVQPIYTEDFEDGTHELYFVASPTDAENCNVTIVEEDGNKYLHCLNSTGEGENGYIQLAFGPELRNFDYTIRVRPYIKNPDHNWIKLVLRGLDGVNYNCDGYENESYLFNIWEWRGVFTIKSLSKKYSETVPMVENQDFWFDNGTWYTIKVEARDTNFKVYVDGELCADYTDTEDVIKWGVFGLCSWGGNFDVDDITIISYDDPDMTYGNYNLVEENDEEAAIAPIESVNLLPLVKAEAGVFNYNEDGSLQVWGRTADGAGDAYTDSWHILGRKVGDFELNFDYNTQKTEWMQDRICFRCAADENGWNQYQVLICGSYLGDNAAGIRIVKGEAYDHAYAYYPCTFEAGKNYEFKLVVIGNNVKLYMNGEQIIDVDLPTEGGEYYKDYIPEGDFQIITWGGDFVITHMELKEIAE